MPWRRVGRSISTAELRKPRAPIRFHKPRQFAIVTKKPTPKASEPERLTLRLAQGETPQQGQARIALDPGVDAALTLRQLVNPHGESSVTLDGLIGELRRQCDAASGGELAREEAMLVAQAHTLDGLFHTLARRAASNMGEYLGACEAYLRLALKAQSQCRATVETLAIIKHPPPVAFVRQANIAAGPQQVNNGIPTSPIAGAREIESTPTKLSGGGNELRQDTGTSAIAGRVDS